MPNTELLVRVAVAALNAGHDIRANSELALRMQLAVAELENDRLYRDIDRLTDERAEARCQAARLELENDGLRAELDAARAGRHTAGARWAAAWKRAAKERHAVYREQLAIAGNLTDVVIDRERELAAAREEIRSAQIVLASRDERIAALEAALAGSPTENADVEPLRRENERLRRKLVALKAEPEPETKTCRMCGVERAKADFYLSTWSTESRPVCRACARTRDQERRKAERAKDDLPFACEDCGERFSVRRGLVAHRAKMHPAARPAEPIDDDPLPFEATPFEVALAQAGWSCPACGSEAFAQAINGDVCIKCAAQARKAA